MRKRIIWRNYNVNTPNVCLKPESGIRRLSKLGKVLFIFGKTSGMRQQLWIIVFSLNWFLASAQLLDGESPITRADTLRGMLTETRSCYDVGYYDLTVRVVPDKQ